MSLSKLKSMNKWFYAFLGVALALIVAIVVIVIVSVSPDKPPVDTSIKNPTDGPETGVYYYEVAGGEVLLSLNSGNKFTLAGPDINKSGDYTVNGESITLDFVRDEDGTATALLQNDTVVLNYNNASMTFLKKVYYTVTFNTNNGSAIDAVKVLNGKLLTAPDSPTKENSVFLGWYQDEALTTRYQFDTAVIKADTTVYAKWADKVVGQREYYAAFSLGYDNAPVLEAIQTIGGKLYEVPTPERTGYTFCGWYISMYEDGEKLTYAYTEDTVLDANTTLFAVWKDNTATKLSAPGVSVSGTSIKWNAVDSASGYKVTVTDETGKVLFDESVGSTTQTFDFESLPAGDYKIEVTAVSANAANNSDAAVRYFKNKALKRVSAFQVIDGVLIFNEVEGAEKYLITVDCGNDNHKHTLFDNSSSTSYDLSNCPMQDGGIKIVVTAVGTGYANSVSETFIYNKVLEPVGNIVYKTDTDSFVWDAVADAAGYTVTVTVGGKTYTFDNGNKTTFSVANYTGSIKVSVTPVTPGYNSPAAVTASCEKTAPAAPTGLAINNNTLTWDAVQDATSYEIKIGSQTYTATENSFDLSKLTLTSGSIYPVSVKAIKGSESSQYSDSIDFGFNCMSPSLSYKNHTVYWTPVLGITEYAVRVNGGATQIVSNASSASVVLTQAGINTIEVRYTQNGGSDWVALQVTAFEIVYNSRSLDGERKEYVAIGDTLTLPTDFTNNGYSFVAWYNTPSGSAGNGTKYENVVFTGNTDLVLYADWTPMSYKVEFQVDGYDITNIAQGDKADVTYTKDYTLPVPTTTNLAYTAFVGWFTGPSGGGVQLTDDEGKSINAFPYYHDTIAYPYFESNVLQYELRADNTYSVKAGPNIASVSQVWIPDTYNGLPVSVIVENGFASRKNLVTINIPDTIKLIGTGAFNGTSNLEAINIYEVEGTHEKFYASHDGALLRYDMGTVYLEVFPAGKTGTYTVSEEVDIIRDKAFQESKISKVIISKNTKSILDKAFYYCHSLTSVEFEGERTTAVVLAPEMISHCTNITSIKLPANIAEISLSMFQSLPKLAAIEVEDGGQRYGSVNGMLTNAIKDTILYAPNAISGVYTVPNAINYIGDDAFSGHSDLTEVIISDHVLGIGANAFKDCAKLVKVTFEGDRTEDLVIGDSAFAGCDMLRDLTFGGSKTAEPCTGAITIGANAFTTESDKPTLLNVKFEDGVNVKSIGAGAFANQTQLYNLSFGNNIIVEEIGANAFQNNTSLMGIIIPATTKIIGDGAFQGCSNAAYVKFTEGGDNIAFGSSAFAGCAKLTKIELPASITKFTGSEFAGCDALNEIVVSENNDHFKAIDGVLYGIDANKNPVSLLFYPKALDADPEALAALPWDTLTEIGDSAFENNTKVTAFEITPKLTKIGARAFSGCTALTSVTTKQGGSALTVGDYAFSGCTAATTVELPEYTTAIGVSAFEKSVFVSFNMPDSIVSIGEKAFASNTRLTAIDIPAKVDSIGAGAFYGCTALAAVNFAESTTEVTLEGGDNLGVFQNCSKLSALDFNGRVTFIGDFAFSNSGIASIDIVGVTHIGNSAFYNAKQLTSIYIPADVTFIGNSAFKMSAGAPAKLTKIEFELGGTKELTLGKTVFQFVPITEITLPNRIGELYSTLLTSPYGGFEVTDIFEQFENATSLKAVNVEAGSTKYASIDGVLYETDENGVPVTLLFCPVMNEGRIVDGKPTYEIIVPNTVTLVANRAFRDVRKITTVTFEEFDEDSEFYGKPLLSIGNSTPQSSSGGYVYGVFGGSTNASAPSNTTNTLTTINFPSHLAKLTAYAVTVTKGNITVTFNPDATIELYVRAFDNAKLTGVTLNLPNVSRVESYAFTGTKLAGITFGENSSFTYINSNTFNGTNIQNLVLPACVKELGMNALSGMSALTSFSVAEGSQLEIIGETAFYALSKLTFIDLSNATKLTAISSNAFKNCTGLTSFTFPASVVSVGGTPFSGCTKLESITLSSGFTASMLSGAGATGTASVFSGLTALKEVKIDGENKELSVVDGVLYDKAKTIVYFFPPKKDPTGYVLPDTVKVIETGAFANFTGTSLVLPEGLETIGINAFSNSALESITIPASVTTIGDNAFNNCKNVKTLVFSSGSVLESIGASAFNGLNLVEEIILPDGVHTIGANAFAYCTSLKEIILPAALTAVNQQLFYGCSSLTSVTMQEKIESIGSMAFNGILAKSVTIPASVISIADSAFAKANLLESVTFGEGSRLETIGASVFADCTKLTSIVIPDSVYSIGANAFKNDTALESVTLPENLENISASLFEGATSLKNVNVPEGIISIGTKAFMNTAVTEINLPASLVTIGTSAFEGCASLKSVVFADTNAMTELGAGTSTANNIFKDTAALETVVLPAGLKTIGGHVFENSAISEIYFPASLTTIGDYAFANCDSMVSVALSGDVTYIGDYAFTECDNLKNADLSFGVEYLGVMAFGNCTKLEKALIPATVVKMGGNPFSGCTSVSAIELDPDNQTFVAENGVIYDASKLTIYCYCGTADNLVIPESVTEIASGAFAGSKLKSITVPGRLGKIGAYTFNNCTELEAVVIEEGITEIGEHAFDGCSKLDNVAIPNTALMLGDYAFANCSALSSFTFADTTSANPYCIGMHFFENCQSITEVILPNYHTITDADAKQCSATSAAYKIGAIPSYMFAGTGIVNAVLPTSVTCLQTDGVFMNCTKLESIEFLGTLSYANLGNYYFYGCSSITEITIPKGGSNPLNCTVGYAFANCTSLVKVTATYSAMYGALYDAAHMFENCTSLTEVVLLSTSGAQGYLSKLGDYYFAGCTSLKSFTVANSANIGNYAFAGCTSLEEFNVANATAKVTKMGAFVFQGCTGFTNFELSFAIPSGTGESIFDGWTEAQTITLTQKTSEISSLIATDVFKGCDAKIYDSEGNLVTVD